MKYRKWTTEDFVYVRAKRALGVQWKFIARDLGTTERSLKEAFARRFGKMPPAPVQKQEVYFVSYITTTQHERLAAEAHRQGVNVSQIVRRILDNALPVNGPV